MAEKMAKKAKTRTIIKGRRVLLLESLVRQCLVNQITLMASLRDHMRMVHGRGHAEQMMFRFDETIKQTANMLTRPRE
jgi:hypothetical protein